MCYTVQALWSWPVSHTLGLDTRLSSSFGKVTSPPYPTPACFPICVRGNRNFLRAFRLIKKCLWGISQGKCDPKMVPLLLPGIQKPGLRLPPAEGLCSSGKSQVDPSVYLLLTSRPVSAGKWVSEARTAWPDTLNSAGSSQVFMRWLQGRYQHLVQWPWAMGVNWGPGQNSGHYQSQYCNVKTLAVFCSVLGAVFKHTRVHPR